MAALATNVAANQGFNLAAAYTPATVGGDDCATGAGVCLFVKNATGAAITVTLVTPQSVDGDLAVADRTFSVPLTNGEFLIPVPDLYRNPATGRANITYSATGLNVAVVRVPTS